MGKSTVIDLAAMYVCVCCVCVCSSRLCNYFQLLTRTQPQLLNRSSRAASMAIHRAAREAQKRWSSRAQRPRLQGFLRFWSAAQSQIDEFATKIAGGNTNRRRRIVLGELRSMIRLWKADRLLTFDLEEPYVHFICRNCESGRPWQYRHKPHLGCEDCVVQDCPL